MSSQPHLPTAVTTAPASQAGRRLRWATVEDEVTLPGLESRVTHPEFRGIEFVHVRARSLLNRVPDAAGLPFAWTINPYRGCTHACTYCFARPSHTWLDLDAGRDFESVIVVKINAVERLRAELRSPRWRGEHVALGTNTDPYQRAEGRYRLTRGIVSTLTEAGSPYSLLTKGTLVTRDLDVLVDAAQRGVCTSVSFSIPTLDEQVWRTSEPGTPHPRSRLEAVATLARAGVPTGVFVAPIIPGLSSDTAQLEDVVASAAEAGAETITPIVLHLRPGVREQFLPWLAEVRPDLLEHHRRLYRGSYAPARVRDEIVGRVRDLVDRHLGPSTRRGRRVRPGTELARTGTPPGDPRTAPPAQQLTLG